MPAEVFGPHYRFMENRELLSFTEMEAIVRAGVALGVQKVRLTGGEPLLRRGIDDLVALLASVEGLQEIALTTNGTLLAHYAERLSLAGLSRVTVSLDALDSALFSQMNGVGAKVERVLKGVELAQHHGLPVKLNAVIQRGVNESQVLPMLRYALERGLELRFIEYMDVGETNKWQKTEVVPTAEVQQLVGEAYTLEPETRNYGAVAEHYEVYDGGIRAGRVGFISSVSRPFCADCGRLRVSANGSIYGCLFTDTGMSLKELVRAGATHQELISVLSGFWGQREDRYSELRGKVSQKKVEMSYIGG